MDQVQYSESMKSILYLRSYAEVRERNSEEKSDDSKNDSRIDEKGKGRDGGKSRPVWCSPDLLQEILEF